jgi:hypothetical protein
MIMVTGRRYGAVVLSSCRAAADSAQDCQPPGATRPGVVQAAERNVLLSRADLEVCASSQRSADSEPA